MNCVVKPPQSNFLDHGHPLAQGLVGYWPFWEGGGTQVMDVSGHNGLYINSFMGDTAFTTGPLGSCLDFPGADDIVKLRYWDNPSGIFTIAAVATFDSISGHYAICGADSYNDGNRVFQFINDDGKLRFISFVGGDVHGCIDTEDMVAGQPYLCVVVSDGASTLLYKDGVLVGSDANGPVDNDPAAWALGGVPYNDDWTSIGNDLDGQLHAYMYWDCALIPGEIADLYADPWGLITPRTTSWFIPATQGDSAPAVTGTAAQTAPAAEQAATGTETLTGTAAQTAPAAEQAATGTETLTGTAAQTAPAAEQAATGTETLTGTAAQTTPAAEQAATGTETLTGTAAQTTPAAEQAATGTETLTGTAAQTAPAAEQAATGTETLTGTAAQTAPAAEQAATGTETLTGTAAQTAPAAEQTATGVSAQAVTGTAAQTAASTEQAATGALSSALVAEEITGVFSTEQSIVGIFSKEETLTGVFSSEETLTGVF